MANDRTMAPRHIPVPTIEAARPDRLPTIAMSNPITPKRNPKAPTGEGEETQERNPADEGRQDAQHQSGNRQGVSFPRFCEIHLNHLDRGEPSGPEPRAHSRLGRPRGER